MHSFVEITTMHSYVKLLVLCLLAIFAAQASAKDEKIVVEEEVDWCKAKCSGDKECRANKAECLAAKAEEEAAKAEKEAEEEADKNTDWCKKKCGGDKACKAKKEACKKAKEEAAKKEEEDKKKKEEKEEGGQKPKPTGKTDAYGIPVTKKSGMNRACRTCSSPACLSTSSNRATTHRRTDSPTR